MAGLQTDADAFAAAAEARVAPVDEKKHAKLEETTSDLHESIHDGIHDGLVLATEDDLHTLRRVADKVPWNAYRASRDSA